MTHHTSAAQLVRSALVFISPLLRAACGSPGMVSTAFSRGQRAPAPTPRATVIAPAVVALLAALQTRYLTPSPESSSRTALLQAAPGQASRRADGWLPIHVFAQEADALQLVATRLHALDQSMADWIAAPQCYHHGRLLVLIVGSDVPVLRFLADVCGPPIATRAVGATAPRA